MLVVAAFRIGHRTRDKVAGFVPNPWIAGVFSLAVSNLYMLTEMLPGWVRVGVCLLLAIGFFTIVSLWSHRIGWSEMHRLAIAGGGILTFAWLGIGMEPESGPKTAIDHIGSAFLVCGAIVLLAIAVRNLRKFEKNVRSSNKNGGSTGT